MTIGVAYERIAAHVTVVLGNERWEYSNRRVSVDKERGVVQIYAGDKNRLVATAPLSATLVEWVEEEGARKSRATRGGLRRWAGAPTASELESAVDRWLSGAEA